MVDLRQYQGCLVRKRFKEENSKGRRDIEDEDGWLFETTNPFGIDSLKVEKSKAKRRLDTKTQVFSFPSNVHIRNRASHSREVAVTSQVIAGFLGLNSVLCGTIAQAHDIGHVPFGHAGEAFIRQITGRPFSHAKYGAVVAQEIERRGKGMNLSFEVLAGVCCHSGDGLAEASAEEYRLVYHNDKINYVSHDINDAIRVGYLEEKSLPDFARRLGQTQREREKNCFEALIKESAEQGKVSFGYSLTARDFARTRQWMFEKVYNRINERPVSFILGSIYDFFAREDYFSDCDPIVLISLLSDEDCYNFARNLLTSISIKGINTLGFMEIVPFLRGKKINWEEPDFFWATKKSV
ncbi:MAG: HD domain-containing protein [Candidatus Portnoybacteria bacterium]|jgi:dGTPase|nr:HD domain-containing protein [Candidatus Portnoybacteria bacterium]